MDQRLKLQKILENILESRNVYYQPPSNTKLEYPCIIYKRSSLHTRHANNSIYINKVRYEVLLISNTPNNPTIDKILELPYCTYDRYYVADGLSHDSFTVFY